MSDPRHRPHPTTSNSFAARGTSTSQRPNEASDLTWLDFLRTAGGTVPDRSDSADRKRRRAGTSPERRGYPQLASDMPVPGEESLVERRASATGYRRPSAVLDPQHPIDLLSQTQTLRRVVSGGDGTRGSTGNDIGERGSDVPLPSWQPDAEVNQCPVCHTDFGFWYRKHHCRKCGRVVCAACSPHRITIPRQYIVQPPNPFETEFLDVEVNSQRPVNSALGGGEVVRVCNPCVPDPWTPETASPRTSEPTNIAPRPLIDRARNSRSGEATGGRSEQPNHRTAPMPALAGARTRALSHQPTTNTIIARPQDYLSTAAPTRSAVFPGSALPPVPHHSRPLGHRYSHSNAADVGLRADPRYRGPPRLSQPTVPEVRVPTKPKKKVREEDECPVCGEELPPGDALRETHIQECIATRFSSSTPSSSTMQPPIRPSVPENASTGASSSTPPATTTSQPPAPRPRATSYRPRGMALYRATEKDCSTEDGEPQECVICFEEFQPGDEMGRMECLCKFHRVCLRQWWDTKGDGSCPTHQLHD